MNRALWQNVSHEKVAPKAVVSPSEEVERQAAVLRSGILQRRCDAGLQRVVEVACRTYHVRSAVISIIDRHRQWFAARVGIEPDETPRADSFCLHAIRTPGEPLVVLDALDDRRFSGNPMVTGTPHIRFYAGVPLLDRGGYPLGALCLIDDKPRDSAPSLFQLIRLAHEAERIIAR
jgi:GAF domain-containing protein